MLAAIIADLKAHAPDHIAITGDLTNYASPAEYEARPDMAGDAGPRPRDHRQPRQSRRPGRAQGRRPFAAWTPWLGDGGDDAVAFPQVRVRDGVALFNLCSAAPTAPHLATGRLGTAQLERLDALLGDPAYRDAFRVLLIHHPPVPGAVAQRKSLEDQDALRALLARHGADLVLHGHGHEASVATAPGPGGKLIPVLGVPSASAMGERGHPAARWHGVEIDRQADGGIEVTAGGARPGPEDRPAVRTEPFRAAPGRSPGQSNADSAPVAHPYPHDGVAGLGREPRGLERRQRRPCWARRWRSANPRRAGRTALRSKSRLALAS